MADLARLAYETIQELMGEAVGDPRARPGVVAVPKTLGGAVRPHPHSHCLGSRGVWNDEGQWTPGTYIDTTAAEKLFRHKVIRLLKNKGLLNDERIEKRTNLNLSTLTNEGSPPKHIDPTISLKKRAALRKRWAPLIRRVYLTDPLICPDCGSELRVIAFITEPKVIRKILRHLQNRHETSRAHPNQQTEPVIAST